MAHHAYSLRFLPTVDKRRSHVVLQEVGDHLKFMCQYRYFLVQAECLEFRPAT